jgi:molybdopterin molybdotransferase
VLDGGAHGRLHVGDPRSGTLAPHPGYVEPGSDIRPRGDEAAAGSVLLEAGGVVTPAVAGLAASTGLETVPVVRPPDVALVIPGRGRDLLGPVLPGWVAWAGGRAFPPQRAIAGLDEVVELVDDANADVVVLTGAETVDAREALARLRARWIVDGVDVEPGPESGLAELADGRLVVLLPADPLGAVSGVVTLLVPLLATLRGELGADEARLEQAVLDGDVRHGVEETRLVPVVRRPAGGAAHARALSDDGPGRLRGLALADGLAVVPCTGGRTDGVVAVLPLP